MWKTVTLASKGFWSPGSKKLGFGSRFLQRLLDEEPGARGERPAGRRLRPLSPPGPLRDAEIDALLAELERGCERLCADGEELQRAADAVFAP